MYLIEKYAVKNKDERVSSKRNEFLNRERERTMFLSIQNHCCPTIRFNEAFASKYLDWSTKEPFLWSENMGYPFLLPKNDKLELFHLGIQNIFEEIFKEEIEIAKRNFQKGKTV